jgi:beta-glucanase (GH16 family)
MPIFVALVILTALSEMLFATFGHSSASEISADCAGTLSNRELRDDFTQPTLAPCLWVIVRSNWGGKKGNGDYNSGVVPENVSLRDNTLVLTARGNLYDGPVQGVKSDGTPSEDGRRSGAAVMTRDLYLGGRFEANVKIIKHPGVVSAMWTFFYDQLPDGTVRNHEIDIEIPGNADADSGPSFDHATLTAWTGLKPGESTAAYCALPNSIADDKFHRLMFDWRPPGKADPGSVEFYIDGRLCATTRTNVPSKPANLWLGVWFPPDWAGIPDFEQAEMLVNQVRITPLSKTAKR